MLYERRYLGHSLLKVLKGFLGIFEEEMGGTKEKKLVRRGMGKSQTPLRRTKVDILPYINQIESQFIN